MKRRPYELWQRTTLIFLTLAIFVLAAAAVYSTKYPEDCYSSHEAAQTTQQNQDKECWGQRAVDDPVSVFTLLLVIIGFFQLGLFWWQLNLIRDSADDAKLASEAANIAAQAALRSADTAERALTTLERPFVYCSVSKPGIKSTDLSINSHVRSRSVSRSNMELSVYNFGRTPARITRFLFRVTLPTGPICDPIDPLVEGGNELPVGTVTVKDDPFLQQEDLTSYFLGEDEAISANQKVVWVCGFVRYDDIFGTHHINGFALKFDTGLQRFVRSGGDQYNYERKEEHANIPQFPTSVA